MRSFAPHLARVKNARKAFCNRLVGGSSSKYFSVPLASCPCRVLTHWRHASATQRYKLAGSATSWLPAAYVAADSWPEKPIVFALSSPPPTTTSLLPPRTAGSRRLSWSSVEFQLALVFILLSAPADDKSSQTANDVRENLGRTRRACRRGQADDPLYRPAPGTRSHERPSF